MNRHLLIIYPHWPPSNLAGMHRARLVANGARDCGWDVTVIAVHPDHYEESPDPEMEGLVRKGIEVILTEAFPVLRLAGMRLIGDIGLRGFRHIRAAAQHWLEHHRTDFIWFPIPSWYTPLMAPRLSRKFRTPYGVDYIDPWVYQLTEHEPMFSRAWWTRKAALILEPRAIRKAALISGVAEEYFLPALRRNFTLEETPVTVSFPYGFDPEDHKKEPINSVYPFDPQVGRYIFYAGAFLPHSEPFARQLLAAVASLVQAGKWPADLKLQFVGTGRRPGPSIADLAEEMDLGDIVCEHPERIPFLSVQSLLRKAQTSLVLGSTEAHYTASKTFQCLLAGNPVISILHQDSSALTFIQSCKADQYSIGWHPSMEDISADIEQALLNCIQSNSQEWDPDLKPLNQHTSTQGTRLLLEAIESLTG